MPDTILVRDLLVRGIVGINPEERVKTQDIVINLALEADTKPAAASDAIEDAVNYRTIAKRVIELVEGSGFYLVERLADRIAALCLEDARVTACEVTVEKPTALRFAGSVGVKIRRERGGG